MSVTFYLIRWLVLYVLLCLCVYEIIAVDVWVVSGVVARIHFWSCPLRKSLFDMHVQQWTYPRNQESKSVQYTPFGYGIPWPHNCKAPSQIMMVWIGFRRAKHTQLVPFYIKNKDPHVQSNYVINIPNEPWNNSTMQNKLFRVNLISSKYQVNPWAPNIHNLINDFFWKHIIAWRFSSWKYFIFCLSYVFLCLS